MSPYFVLHMNNHITDIMKEERKVRCPFLASSLRPVHALLDVLSGALVRIRRLHLGQLLLLRMLLPVLLPLLLLLTAIPCATLCSPLRLLKPVGAAAAAVVTLLLLKARAEAILRLLRVMLLRLPGPHSVLRVIGRVVSERRRRRRRRRRELSVVYLAAVAAGCKRLLLLLLLAPAAETNLEETERGARRELRLDGKSGEDGS